MQYSEVIWNLHQQGKSTAEIIAYINSPFVDEQTVHDVVMVVKRANYPLLFPIRQYSKNGPKPTSRVYAVHMLYQKLGDAAFKEEYKKSAVAMAKRYNVVYDDLKDYHEKLRHMPSRMFYMGKLTYKEKLRAEGKIVNDKTTTLQDVLKLF